MEKKQNKAEHENELNWIWLISAKIYISCSALHLKFSEWSLSLSLPVYILFSENHTIYYLLLFSITIHFFLYFFSVNTILHVFEKVGANP